MCSSYVSKDLSYKPFFPELHQSGVTSSLAQIRKSLEIRVDDLIKSQQINPTYQRARTSTGKVKPEGVLENVIIIDHKTATELRALTTPPTSDNPEDFIAFLARCAKIESAANKQQNTIIKVTDSPYAERFSHLSRRATFFTYNCEGINDYGWGCCWRATQTSLSVVAGEQESLPAIPTFENLFHLFGTNEALEKIYVNFLIKTKKLDLDAATKQARELFSKSKFSPYQHAYGWSNPFVSQLMFHYYGLESKMVTVNGMPASLKERNLPDSLCDADFDFPTLTDWLVKHFSDKDPLPVVIDDGKFAMAIVGIKVDHEGATLLFADPHIQGGATHPESKLVYNENNVEASFSYKPESDAGLYWVSFDRFGRQTDCSVKSHELMFSRNSYEGTQFHTKPWMFTFPKR